jgi:hypothetical protein
VKSMGVDGRPSPVTAIHVFQQQQQHPLQTIPYLLKGTSTGVVQIWDMKKDSHAPLAERLLDLPPPYSGGQYQDVTTLGVIGNGADGYIFGAVNVASGTDRFAVGSAQTLALATFGGGPKTELHHSGTLLFHYSAAVLSCSSICV